MPPAAAFAPTAAAATAAAPKRVHGNTIMNLVKNLKRSSREILEIDKKALEQNQMIALDGFQMLMQGREEVWSPPDEILTL